MNLKCVSNHNGNIVSDRLMDIVQFRKFNVGVRQHRAPSQEKPHQAQHRTGWNSWLTWVYCTATDLKKTECVMYTPP